MRELIAREGNYRPGRTKEIRYLVVHYTANNGDTAWGNCQYFAREKVTASAHYFVDENEVCRSVRDEDTAYHCGASVYKHPECRNENSIGVELCSRKNADGTYYFLPDTIRRAQGLIRELMARYDIPVSRVVRHYDVTGKICPAPLMLEGNWFDFLQGLENEDMANLEKIKALARQILALCDEPGIPEMPTPTPEMPSTYSYRKVNNHLHEIKTPISRFKIERLCKAKRNASFGDYITGMFFVPAGNDPTWGPTMPVGNFYAEGHPSMQAKYIPTWIKEHREKKLSTFFVYKDDSVKFERTSELDGRTTNLKYALSGIPMLLGGKEVSMSRDIVPEGYGDDKFYNTWHTLVSFKEGYAYIYAWRNTKSGGAAATTELYNLFSGYGFDNMIMLDGGGSFILNVGGKEIAGESENRVIDTVVRF